MQICLAFVPCGYVEETMRLKVKLSLDGNFQMKSVLYLIFAINIYSGGSKRVPIICVALCNLWSGVMEWSLGVEP